LALCGYCLDFLIPYALPFDLTGDKMGHPVKDSLYVGIFVALIALTGATVGVSYMDLGGMGNLAVGLLIASVKATLVALFFMHLKGEERIFFGIIIFSLVLFGIFVVALLPDIGKIV